MAASSFEPPGPHRPSPARGVTLAHGVPGPCPMPFKMSACRRALGPCPRKPPRVCTPGDRSGHRHARHARRACPVLARAPIGRPRRSLSTITGGHRQRHRRHPCPTRRGRCGGFPALRCVSGFLKLLRSHRGSHAKEGCGLCRALRGSFGMRLERDLLLGLAAAATLCLVCALTWTQDTGLFGVPPREASITPTSGSKAQAARQTDAPAPPEVVVLAPRGGPPSSPTWGSPWSDRLPLAQQLQRELARVGCYDGEINGVWTPATRRALKAFMDRVNAALPTEAPDRIQLALVEAARERVCGAACPAGETLAEGRCIPNVVLAGRKFAPNAVPATSRTGLVTGEQATGQAGLPQTATGISTPGQAPTTAPGNARVAEAKRRRGQQPGFFGLAVFKQFLKLGF